MEKFHKKLLKIFHRRNGSIMIRFASFAWRIF